MVKRSAFLLPFFVFAGLFKEKPFSMSRFYLDATFWLAVVLFVLGILRVRKFRGLDKYNPLLWIIFPLAVFILITPLFSAIHGEELPYFGWKVRHFFLIVVPSILLCYWHLESENDWFYFRKGILWLSFIISIYLLTHSVLAMWGQINYLMLGIVPGIGGIIVFHESFSEVIMRRDGNHDLKLRSILLFGLFTVGLFYSYARGEQIAYLIIINMLLLTGFFQLTMGDVGVRKIGLILMIFVMLVVLITFLYQRSPNLFVRYFYMSNAFSTREHLFGRAIDLFERYPVLPLGIGGYHLAGYKYPHCMLLEFMSEMGIWGGMWYVFILSLATLGYFRYRKISLIWEHFYVFFYLILLSGKEGSAFSSKAFWVWTAIGIGLVSKSRLKLRM